MKAYRKPSIPPRSNKLVKSISKANAEGYARRLARKTRASASSTDVYELVQEKTRRSDILLDLDRNEVRESGVSYNEAKEEQKEALRARLIGENVDDEEIPSGDDEEIDSDDAFEDSDEERFAGFFLSKRKSAIQSAEVDLDEDEEMGPSFKGSQDNDEEDEEEIGDDDEFIDLVDALDGKGDTDAEVDDTKKDPVQDTGLHDEDDEVSSEGEFENANDARDDEMALAPSDDEEVPEALAQLHNFVSNLEPTIKKRKVVDEGDPPDTNDRTRRRRLLQETTEAGDENEFRVQSIGAKLNLDDLLAPLSGHSSALQSLRKSTKVLAPSVSLKAKALSAPLPQRTQDRLDRQAAYQQTKEEVDKWSETMKRIREAEHLSFPLQSQSTGRVSNLELNATFKPTTDLERSVDSLLKAAKMKEDNIQHTEDTILKTNHLSIEEIAQRRSELRKMRELMFRAEIKARRINKIKSKTYRRLRRKEKARLGESIDENDDVEVEEGRLKSEIERAKERATLRHKNTGKWAKKMKGRDDLYEDTRKDVEDMLARSEKLRRRIQGVGSDESQEESDKDDGDEELDLEEGIVKVKQDAFNELAKLDDQEDVGGDGKKGKSVFEMKFMKDAMARQAAATNKEVDDFIKEMEGSHAYIGEDETVNVQENDSSSGVIAMRAGGRVVYRPGAPINTLARPQSDASSVTLNSTDLLSPPPASPLPTIHPGLSAPAASQELNPWLTRDVRTTAKAPKKNAIVVGKDSDALDKAKHNLKKQVGKGGKEREKAKDDAIVEISTNNNLLLPPIATGSSTLKTSTAKLDGCASEDGFVDSEVESQEMALLKRKKGSNGLKAFEQKDLVALAFAGDNVVQSFEDAKHREIATDAPREVDTAIPGWGSWGGAGIKKATPKPARLKKVPGINPASRADYGNKNIIISEKRDKKAAKYLVKDLPYPYTSKAQFERAMDTPIGPEWNTRVGFQRGTLPRVVKKPGVIIEPLEKQS